MNLTIRSTNHPHRTTLMRVLLATCCSLLLSACNDFAAAVREVTYPPDFVYVSGEEFRSRMEQLAYQLQLLDGILSDEFMDPSQAEVLNILAEIEDIGSGLQAGEAGASHPFLQNDMQIFVSQVMRARMAASLDPPRYYLSGRVPGACVNCHQLNR